jgi:hypothetical protein
VFCAPHGENWFFRESLNHYRRDAVAFITTEQFEAGLQPAKARNEMGILIDTNGRAASGGGLSTYPAPESRDPYLAIVAVQEDGEVPVKVIATVGLKEPRTVVIYHHGYAALIDELIEEPAATFPRRRRDGIWRQCKVIEQVQVQVPEVRG